MQVSGSSWRHPPAGHMLGGRVDTGRHGAIRCQDLFWAAYYITRLLINSTPKSVVLFLVPRTYSGRATNFNKDINQSIKHVLWLLVHGCLPISVVFWPHVPWPGLLPGHASAERCPVSLQDCFLMCSYLHKHDGLEPAFM